MCKICDDEGCINCDPEHDFKETEVLGDDTTEKFVSAEYEETKF